MATFFRGDPLSIATEGLLSTNAITIATKGLLVTAAADLVTGGEAGQSQTFFVNAATNGLTFDGTAGINKTFTVIAIGGIVIGGTADIDIIHTPTVGGNLVTGGLANINITMVVIGQNGLTSGGTAGQSFSRSFIAAGGLLFGGTAPTQFIPGGLVGRGGAAGPPEFLRRPVSSKGFGARKKKWIAPIKALEPKDYWKRIEIAIELAKEREKPRTHEFSGSGSLGKLTPNSVASPLFRDQTLEPTRVPYITPTNNYSIDGLYVNDITTDDLINVEDEMFLNDQINNGDYILDIGKKQRFIHEPKDGLKLSFSNEAEVKYIDYILELIEKEDREFILGENPESDNDDDELKLLGVI